ncbi:unnamed protein product [Rotaria sordida]|uniref:F-box domain-containing protein n=2 Tax=Rotaria sordida TaxID=392033 RepID=A0A819JNJ5_9BILA|nr:unnamed protein product [Rotaria sordida]
MSISTYVDNNFTLLEALPNEIFLEIFQYLNGVDTIYAFSQLNNRFQHLLIKYVKTFDFKSITKVKFDFVTQHHDIHRWRSLRLSEDIETPGQIGLFCQLFPLPKYISQIQSLSILNMKPKFAKTVLSQLISFDYLISLTVTTICGENIQPFKLSSLKQLVFTGCKHNNWIKNFDCLKTLEYTIKYSCHADCILTLPKTLKQLKLFYNEAKDGNALQISLSQMSQLTKLALYDNGNYSLLPDGGKWEKLIKSSLPLLKTFQFCFYFLCYRNSLNDVNQAMSSFSTTFYLVEKCWFIRCDSDNQYSVLGAFYTMPFAFAEMRVDINSCDMSTSTLTANNVDVRKYESYEKVETLMFNEICQMPCQGFLTFNIVRLILNTDLPTSWYFLLNNLHHLEFRRNVHMSATDFAHFLTNAPQLQSLTLLISVLIKLTDSFTNKAVCDQLSQRIQSLTISDCLSNHDYGQNMEPIHILSNIVRIFGNTCEHLSLNLATIPQTVLPILGNMRQLHSLHIHYPSWRCKSYIPTTYWFQQSTSETDVSDIIYTPDDLNFYIWFGKRR